MKYLIALLSVLLGATGQYFFKIGVDQIRSQNVNLIIGCMKNLSIWGGLVFYGLSVLVWFYVLSQMELSRAYPLVSMGYIITLLIGYFLLHEPITLYKTIGIACIMLGVFFISR